MKFEICMLNTEEITCDILLLGIWENEDFAEREVRVVSKAEAESISNAIHSHSDCSKFGNILEFYSVNESGPKHIMLLGLGKKECVNLNKVRDAFAIAARQIQKLNFSGDVGFLLGDSAFSQFTLDNVVKSIVEGIKLGSYQFNFYKTDKPNFKIEKFSLYIRQGDTTLLREAARTGSIISQGVNFARDLTNHPSQYMTPTKMGNYASKIAQETGMKLSILLSPQMEKQQMNSILAVAQGSNEPPCLIVLEYQGDASAKDTIALIGKGVTFDSGGISLKPSANMGEMKGDMAGGATVLGAMQAIARLKLNMNVIGIVPCVENMPSGHALKPGDIIKTMSGKTVEIITTDAEGRLILADGITYARSLGATKIIDIATLTGACVVALGNVASGVVSNDPKWCKQVLQAATTVGEKMWELPNYPEYTDQIKSEIADLKNSGGRMAGAITAGVFLGQFAEKIPWVHIDIAGTSDIDKARGCNGKGATGSGVRTLVQVAIDIGAGC